MKTFTTVIIMIMGLSYFCFAQLPPTISVEPDTIEVYLPEGGSTLVPVFIHNMGDSTLIWEAMVTSGGPPPDCTCTEIYPDSGEVPPDCTVTADAEPGDCTDDTMHVELLIICSNDPVTVCDTIPIIIHVAPVGIEDENSIPKGFAVSQNYPNPFNPVTTINYQLPQSGYVELTVFDNLGRRVRTLTHSKKPPGNHEVLWDGRSDAGTHVGSGIYIYRLRVANYQVVRKMVLLR